MINSIKLNIENKKLYINKLIELTINIKSNIEEYVAIFYNVGLLYDSHYKLNIGDNILTFKFFYTKHYHNYDFYVHIINSSKTDYDISIIKVKEIDTIDNIIFVLGDSHSYEHPAKYINKYSSYGNLLSGVVNDNTMFINCSISGIRLNKFIRTPYTIKTHIKFIKYFCKKSNNILMIINFGANDEKKEYYCNNFENNLNDLINYYSEITDSKNILFVYPPTRIINNKIRTRLTKLNDSINNWLNKYNFIECIRFKIPEDIEYYKLFFINDDSHFNLLGAIYSVNFLYENTSIKQYIDKNKLENINKYLKL